MSDSTSSFPRTPSGSSGAVRRRRRWVAVWTVAAGAAAAVAAAFGAPAWAAALPLGAAVALAGTLWGARAATGGLLLAAALIAASVARGGAPANLAAAVALAALLALPAAGAAVAAARRRAEREADAHARRARLLASAATRFLRSESAEDLLEKIPATIGEELDFSHATVFLVERRGDPDGGGAERPSDDHADAAWVATLSTGYLSRNGTVLPVGLEVRAPSVTISAARRGETIYVPDTAHDARYLDPSTAGERPAPTTRSELAMPIRRGGEVVAVLNVERGPVDAFDPDDRATLEAFLRIGEEALERIDRIASLRDQRRDEAFLARLANRLLGATSRESIARLALDGLLGRPDVDAAAVMVVRGDRLVPLDARGAIPERARGVLGEGIPIGRGQLGVAWRERRTVLIPDYADFEAADAAYRAIGLRGLALVPIVNGNGEVEALLEFGSFDRPIAWNEDDRAHFALVADTIGAALERATLQRQFAEVLTVVRSLVNFDDRNGDPTPLYQRVVEAAVRVVPGAEAASIQRRFGDGFRFVAAVGFDEATLRSLEANGVDEALAWYRAGRDGFLGGVPRLLTGDEVRVASLDSAGAWLDRIDRDAFVEAARLDEVQANIVVPIAYQGEVTGLLNIDNLSRPDAFGRSALRVAEAFAQQLAVIFQQAEYREALQRLAVTDALTGLGNREGFDRTMREELGRAARYDRPLSLVLMDLDGFKAINDARGHQAGDRVLVEVARALESERRENDRLFRWGGDEFALILPETGRREATTAGERYRAAIGRLEGGRDGLTASLGVATYRVDGGESDELIGAADDRLYAEKSVRTGGAAPNGQ